MKFMNVILWKIHIVSGPRNYANRNIRVPSEDNELHLISKHSIRSFRKQTSKQERYIFLSRTLGANKVVRIYAKNVQWSCPLVSFSTCWILRDTSPLNLTRRTTCRLQITAELCCFSCHFIGSIMDSLSPFHCLRVALQCLVMAYVKRLYEKSIFSSSFFGVYWCLGINLHD